MTALLVYSALLLVAVLLSGLAQRSVLSTAVLFLLGGFVAGPGVLGWIPLSVEQAVVSHFTEWAIFSVLFTDGMRVRLPALASGWGLPARALGLGLPLTLVLTALLARLLTGLPWADALLLGAVLSPTDPVLASALVGREGVPGRLRRLLNVESGMNDGLALPAVVLLLAVASRSETHPVLVVVELVAGVVLGIVVPYLAIQLERTRYFSAARDYEPLHGLAIGLLVFSLSRLLSANEFLAAFTAGITLTNLDPETTRRFRPLGEPVGEVLKLAALLVLGALISPAFLAQVNWPGYVFAALALVVVRPVALGLSLLGAQLNWREWIAALWFGPKGFASTYYGLLVAASGFAYAQHVFHLAGVVVGASVIAHSSTDVIVARWFRNRGKTEQSRDAEAEAGKEDLGPLFRNRKTNRDSHRRSAATRQQLAGDRRP